MGQSPAPKDPATGWKEKEAPLSVRPGGVHQGMPSVPAWRCPGPAEGAPPGRGQQDCSEEEREV